MVGYPLNFMVKLQEGVSLIAHFRVDASIRVSENSSCTVPEVAGFWASVLGPELSDESNGQPLRG